MAIDIVPFSDEHLDAAGELLAARCRAHRDQVPELPARSGNPVEARAEVERLISNDELSGFVAVRDGRFIGYLLGAIDDPPQTDFVAPFRRLGATNIPFAGHAVASDESGGVYQRLYAALAGGWVTSNRLAHYVTVPTHDSTVLEAWYALGFGQSISLTVRGMEPISAAASPNINVRQATLGDEADVLELSMELFRTFADSPILMPVLPETTPSLSEHVRRWLTEPTSPAWLAVRNGRVEALQIFLTPDSPDWFLGPLLASERSIYLFFACTAANARGTGVNTALLARTIEWAREAGYTHCLLHHITASRAAEYWRARGFRPVLHGLCRQVDSRVAPN